MRGSKQILCLLHMLKQEKLAISIHGIGHPTLIQLEYGKISTYNHINKSNLIMFGYAQGLLAKKRPLSISLLLQIGILMSFLPAIRPRLFIMEIKLQHSQFVKNILIMTSISTILNFGGQMEQESLIFTILLSALLIQDHKILQMKNKYLLELEQFSWI